MFESCKFVYENTVICNEYEWFFDVKVNWLVRHKLNTESYEAMTYIPKSESPQDYGSIVLSNDKIFITPLVNSTIPVYDMQTESVQYISVEGRLLSGRSIWSALEKNGTVYFIPTSIDGIIKLDAQSLEVEKIMIERNGYFAWGNVVYDDEYIYFTRILSGELVKYSFASDEFEFHEIEKLTSGGGVVDIGEDLLIVPYNAEVLYLCDKQGNIKNVIDNFPKEFAAGNNGSFSKLIDYNNRIYMLPRTANYLVVFDKMNKTTEVVRSMKKNGNEMTYLERFAPYINVTEKDGEIFFLKSIDAIWINENKEQMKNIEKKCDVSRIKDDFFATILNEDDSIYKLNNFLESV